MWQRGFYVDKLEKLVNEKLVNSEILRRQSNAEELAKKFPELRGLSYVEFLKKLPMDLDFITSSQMHEALNK